MATYDIPTLKDEIDRETVDKVLALDVDKYKYGFETEMEVDRAPKGLSEDTIRFISAKKSEPEWMLEWRLEAYRRWLTMTEPNWAKVHYPKIDFQDMYYYAAPKSSNRPKSLADVDPALLEMYEKLGVPLKERELLAGVEQPPRVAVDAVIDSVSVATTFRAELNKQGIIFCSISEAIREYPDLVRQYLGTVVPVSDNYYATLNSAVFTDGSFCYIPKGVRCPMELSTYFRINEAKTKYSTVQNWYPGDKNGVGGIYNFVTKRGDCRGDNSKISWTQVETGSAITWKYPSCILRGDGSSGEFYSIAISNGHQQVDSGTKMIHLGKNTSSRIVSKGIAAGFSDNTYRGQVSAHAKAKGARNFTQCDSLLIGDTCGAHTVPYIESRNASAVFEHEATTSKISDDQMFYCQQRGLSEEEAVALIVNGFVRDVLQHLPMEFMVETQKLISISLEGSVG
jgi:Fe-S cluster assembly protein SufB